MCGEIIKEPIESVHSLSHQFKHIEYLKILDTVLLINARGDSCDEGKFCAYKNVRISELKKPAKQHKK